MAQLQGVGFRQVKDGMDPADWEDFFAYDEGDPRHGTARCVVLDGAAEAYDSARWVHQLGKAFVGADGEAPPKLERDALCGWIETMQYRWLDDRSPMQLNPFEEIKRREGSFATFLGCQIDGLGTGRLSWRAASLGDVVLFHVRANQTVETFPDLKPDDFGINPEGVFTDPRMLLRMHHSLRITEQNRPLQVGDTLYLASDALAEWLVRARPDEHWRFLGELDDEGVVFAHVISGLRAAGRMKNDDVTLLRLDVTAGDPDAFVVAL